MNEPTLLDVFSGIGGFSLAFEAEGFRTIGFVEHDPIKQQVLKHWWPDTPTLPDVRDTASIARFCEPFGTIDVVTAGVPCQPTSALGQQRGTADERWLWPAMLELVGAVRPRFFVAENPPAILTLEGGGAWNGIVSKLVALGYDLLWDVFPAAAVGAGHLRERVILIATYASCLSQRITPDEIDAQPTERRTRSQFTGNGDSTFADSHGPRLQGHARHGNGSGGGQNERRPVAPESLQQAATDAEHFGPQTTERGGAEQAPDCARKDGADSNTATCKHHPREISSLIGRVNGADWWHEAHTGVPVLATGLPNKLVEAATRCIGDSIVPQVAQIIGRSIYQQIRPLTTPTP